MKSNLDTVFMRVGYTLPRTRKLRLLAGLLLSAVAAASSGCGREDGGQPDAEQAQGEGQPSGAITWYASWSVVESNKLISAFHKTHPDVEVTAIQLGSSQKTERIRAEYRSGVNEMDVVSIIFGLFAKSLADDGILANYRPATLDDYPSERARKIFHDYWSVMAVNPHGICYNKQTISDPPASYEDLLEPRFKNQIVLTTPLQVSGTRNFLIETHGYWGDEKWERFWRGLAEQNVFFTEAAQGIMLLMRGERGVFLYCNMSLYRGAVEKGAPIGWITAEPNVASEVVIAMAEDSDNPVAARAFYDFVMSEQGQNAIANAFSMQPVHPRASLPEVFQDAANVPIVFSPSEFQIQRLNQDPDAMEEYERFAAEVFGLR